MELSYKISTCTEYKIMFYIRFLTLGQRGEELRIRRIIETGAAAALVTNNLDPYLYISEMVNKSFSAVSYVPVDLNKVTISLVASRLR